MMQITPQHHLFLHIQAIDFRKGIDSLVGFCRAKLELNPFSGTVFAFRNSKGTAIKILVYDGTGFCLMHKRFSQGELRFWPKSSRDKICATTFMVILNQGAPGIMDASWRELPASSCL